MVSTFTTLLNDALQRTEAGRRSGNRRALSPSLGLVR